MIRPATSEDTEAILRVVYAAYRGVGDEAGWTTESHLLGGERTNRAEVEAAMTTPGTRLLVAALAPSFDGDEGQGGRVVGVIRVTRRGDDGAAFGLFAVDPSLQSGGIGSALLEAAETVARDDWGRSWIAMEVIHQRTDLQAWYRRRGYEPTGETEPFPYHDEDFGLPKTDDLYFDVFRRPLRTEVA